MSKDFKRLQSKFSYLIGVVSRNKAAIEEIKNLVIVDSFEIEKINRTLRELEAQAIFYRRVSFLQRLRWLFTGKIGGIIR